MIATHVSRPIRSARASGPIGWLKPSLAIVSIASASPTPSSSAYAASLMKGIRIRFETNPGKSRASAGVFPSSTASSAIAAAVASEVSSPRITSTSVNSGTGLKKCIPITRSGRRVAAARDVIGIEDVFEARIASARSAASARANRSAFLCQLREAATHRLETAFRRAGHDVVQRHAAAGRGDDLRDAAAHLPRAHDEYVRETHPRRLSGRAALPARRDRLPRVPFAEVDGARLWWEAAGEGPGVVLLHNGIADSRIWDRQQRTFAERFRVVRYDMRFFGRS